MTDSDVQSYDDYFKPLLNDLLYDSFRQRIFSLKIRLHSKQELLDKDFLESCNVILFIKHEHSLLMSRVLSQKHYLFHSQCTSIYLLIGSNLLIFCQ